MKQENARIDCYYAHWLYEQGFAAYICTNRRIRVHPYDLLCTSDCKGYVSHADVYELVKKTYG